jgi:hypothetical protein
MAASGLLPHLTLNVLIAPAVVDKSQREIVDDNFNIDTHGFAKSSALRK